MSQRGSEHLSHDRHPAFPAWLGTLFNVSGTAINATVAVLAGGLSEHLRTRPRIKLWMNRISGTVLGALAARLAFSERR